MPASAIAAIILPHGLGVAVGVLVLRTTLQPGMAVKATEAPSKYRQAECEHDGHAA
jgi:hypothetical protein